MGWLTNRSAAGEPAAEIPDPDPELELVDTIVDEFFDSYLRWREACDDVRAAYDRWDNCAPQERVLAFEGYCAALDREEGAAHVHSDLAERLGVSA